MGKLRKAYRDPVGFMLDSKLGALKRVGRFCDVRQTARHARLGAGAADTPIGVIMTAHNVEDLLEKAVASVLAQSHKAFELWIIDDASSDNTPGIMSGLAKSDARIKVFRSSKNHGTYWSKNWCLKHIKTPFVTFHDSDDRSLQHRLQYQLGALLDHPRAIATTARWQRIDEGGRAVMIDGAAQRTAAITLMIRRAQALKQIGFFDCVRISADTEYMSRITHKLGRRALYNSRDLLYLGLLREQSLTRGAESGFLWSGDAVHQRRELTGDRLTYHNAFKSWHRGPSGYTALPPLSFPPVSRPFGAPQSLVSDCDDSDLATVQPL